MKNELLIKKCTRCGREIKYYKFKFNSTIKNKVSGVCLICTNKELLSQSSFARQAGKKSYKTEVSAGIIKKPAKRTKRSPKTRAMSNADMWFSRYIRIKFGFVDKNTSEVYCRCFVNPHIIKLAKNMDNGHCFSRSYMKLRFEEDNCRPQNRSSNRFQGEKEHYKFKDNLIKELGKEKVEDLEAMKNDYVDASTIWFRSMSDKYRKKVNKLVKEREIKKWW